MVRVIICWPGSARLYTARFMKNGWQWIGRDINITAVEGRRQVLRDDGDPIPVRKWNDFRELWEPELAEAFTVTLPQLELLPQTDEVKVLKMQIALRGGLS